MSEFLQFVMDRFQTPIGEMVIVADHKGNLRAADWTDHDPRIQRFLRLHYGEKGYELTPQKNPHGLSDKIKRYFAGELAILDTLPTATAGTDFQCSVWRALRAIPCGTTTTYGELAKQIGKPAAVRAVGMANGSNPVGVIVPCHRVIGANGSLTGYGGGLDRKRWLLDHEAGRSQRLRGAVA
ncbi:MAG TPA: methylated-DNA--[protein]-cysteine S-methyltransferase [Terriglobales bacterium]|jgi:methylated-DNA-[protein]-cysteine S-methyltransferase|nr:methylated-DNA--[protein]-cysteine S-methyltransferase [Terriglobales bacterium]